ncbi:MAG: DUF4386 domain-containing protein [Bacteroidia bacterium]
MKSNFKKWNWMLLSGISLLLMAIFAGLAMGLYYPKLIDVQANQVPELKSELNGFIWSFTMVAILDLVVSIGFYNSFLDLNKWMNLFTFLCRMGYTFLLLMSLKELYLLSYIGEYTNNEVIASMSYFNRNWSISLIVFGLHLVTLSMLVCKSNDLPKWVSYLIMFAGILYFSHHLLLNLLPSYVIIKDTINNMIALPCAAGELVLAFYLIKLKFTVHSFSDSAQ